MREEKIAKKRREIEQEEDKLKHLATLASEGRKNSASRTQRATLPNTISSDNHSPTHFGGGSTKNLDPNRVNELYQCAKRKDKKQEALREKVYKE